MRMGSLFLIGYAGALAVLLAALACLLDLTAVPGTVGAAAPLLYVVLNAAAWAAGRQFRTRPAAAPAARSLLALGDALAWVNAFALLYLLQPRPPLPARALATAVAAGLFLVLGWWRTWRAERPDPIYPYFFAVSGALLVFVTRAVWGLSLETRLWMTLVLGMALPLAAPRSGDTLRHVWQAALGLILCTAGVTARTLWARPSEELLVLLLVATAILCWWAWASRRLGAVCRLFGLAALALVTLTITATLYWMYAAPSAYMAATATWVSILVVAGIKLQDPRAEPFSESAHWLAVIVTTGLAAGAALAWLPRLGAPPALRATAAFSVLLAAVALGVLGSWRKRYPAIAASMAGLAANIGIVTFALYLAPLLVAAAGAGLWLAQGAGAAAAALFMLALAALYVGGAKRAQRLYSTGALGVAGVVTAFAAAALVLSTREVAVAVLLLAAAIFLWRSLDDRRLWPYLAFLAATTAAAARWTLGPEKGWEALALAALAVASASVYRLLLQHEGATTRSGLALGAALAYGIWALVLHFQQPSWAAPLLLWLALPLAVGGKKDRGEQREYDEAVVVGDWVETAAHLLAHTAGIALVVLLWMRLGFPLASAAVPLAAWAWGHYAAFASLFARAGTRPVTLATGCAALAVAIASVVLPAASGTPVFMVAAWLTNAAFAFLFGSARSAPVPFRLLNRVGDVLVASSVVAAATGGIELLVFTLMAAAILLLGRSLRTPALAPHVWFLALASASALLTAFWMLAQVETAVLSVLSVALLAVYAALQMHEGRSTKVRLTLAWALAVGTLAALVDVGRTHLSPLTFLPLWLGFLVGLQTWERREDAVSSRPRDPEDRWLGLGGYWLAHAAGAAWLVSALVTADVPFSSAAPVVAVWAWIHLAVSRVLAAQTPHRAATAATAHAVVAFGLAALALATLSRASGWPPVGACALAGLLFVTLSQGWRARWLDHAAAAAFIEGIWIAGLALGVRVPEYYLAPLGVYLLLCTVRQRAPRPQLDTGLITLEEAAGSLRRALLPAAVALLLVVHPFWEVLRSAREVHLYFLGGGTVALLFAITRRRVLATLGHVACVLFVAGAAWTLAYGPTSQAVRLFVASVGLLVIANLMLGGGRGDALAPAHKARRAA